MDAESSQQALVRAQWEPILQVSNQIVLYDSRSKALTITSSIPTWQHPADEEPDVCPYCHRPLDDFEEEPPINYSRVPNYFHLLAMHNQSASRPVSPPDTDSSRPPLGSDTMAEGYFDAFFREEAKLGMGANGSVYLCQHVLDGNPLGRFAIKKIAVGSSHDYLLKILKEVRLLETLRHENIISYHHSWLESARFSSFGPSVPTLFVLMQWAEGGSLNDFILSRQGIEHSGGHQDATHQNDDSTENLSKSERIAQFRNRTQRGARKSNLKAVHLLSTEEIVSLFSDIVAGLAFLHGRSILHLDLKPENVLLTWDTNHLIPRAMLSDFGASRDSLHQSGQARTGVTGTLEYTAPEILERDPATGLFREMDSKADIWSLGIILHKLIFFTTPYQQTVDLEDLENEVLSYHGYIATPAVEAACGRRGIPPSLLRLLETLLDRVPSRRPSCERVLNTILVEKATYVQPPASTTTRQKKRAVPVSAPTNSLVRAPESSPEQSTRIRAASDATVMMPPVITEADSMNIMDRAGSGSDSDRSTSFSAIRPSPRHRHPGRRRARPSTPPSSKPELLLPLPGQNSRSLTRLLWFLARPNWPPEEGVKLLKTALLMGKIVSLAQVSAGGAFLSFNSLSRTSTICLAAALAAADVWDPFSSLSFSAGLLAAHAGLLYFTH